MKKFTAEAAKEWSKTNNKKKLSEEANMTEVAMSDDSEMSYKSSPPEVTDDTSSPPVQELRQGQPAPMVAQLE